LKIEFSKQIIRFRWNHVVWVSYFTAEIAANHV